MYISPTALGSRGGGPIAACFASLLALGEEGFLEVNKETMKTTEFIRKGIEEIS